MTEIKKALERLDENYREEGWGRVTDAALGGCVRPADVEAQARIVARFAHAELEKLRHRIEELEAKGHCPGCRDGRCPGLGL